MKEHGTNGPGVWLSKEIRANLWAHSPPTCRFKRCEIISCVMSFRTRSSSGPNGPIIFRQAQDFQTNSDSHCIVEEARSRTARRSDGSHHKERRQAECNCSMNAGRTLGDDVDRYLGVHRYQGSMEFASVFWCDVLRKPKRRIAKCPQPHSPPPPLPQLPP